MTNTTQDEELYQEILKAINGVLFDIAWKDKILGGIVLERLHKEISEKSAISITDICNKERVRFAKEQLEEVLKEIMPYEIEFDEWEFPNKLKERITELEQFSSTNKEI